MTKKQARASETPDADGTNGEVTVTDQAVEDTPHLVYEKTETEAIDDQLRVYPNHYYDQEGGGKIPVFQPTMDEFEDFARFVTAINHYGMEAGIVKIIPPKEWLDSLPNLDDALPGITIRHPISQHFFGSAGIFTQTNIEARRVYTLREFRDIANENSHVGNKRKPTKRKRGSKNDHPKESTADSSHTSEFLNAESTIPSSVPKTVHSPVDGSMQSLEPKSSAHEHANVEKEAGNAETSSEIVDTSNSSSASNDDRTQNEILNIAIIHSSITELEPIHPLQGGNSHAKHSNISQCFSTAMTSVASTSIPSIPSSSPSSSPKHPISSCTQIPSGHSIIGSSSLPSMPTPPFGSHFIAPSIETNQNSSHMHSPSSNITPPHLVPLHPQHAQLSYPNLGTFESHGTILPNTTQCPHLQPSLTESSCQPLQNPSSTNPIQNSAGDSPKGVHSLTQSDALLHDQESETAAGIQAKPHIPRPALRDHNSETIVAIPVLSETARLDKRPTKIRVICRPPTNSSPVERSSRMLANSTPDLAIPVKLNGDPLATGPGTSYSASKPKRQGVRRSRLDDLDQSGTDHKLSEIADDECSSVEYTVEECKKLERNYWRNISFTPPMYGADLPGSLWSEAGPRTWNLEHLDNILQRIGKKLPGVNTPYLYFGMWKATFAWHVEDMDLYSINFLHFGAPKQWYAIPPNHHGRFETVAKGIFSQDFKKCSQFLRHKTSVLSPTVLANHSIPVNRLVQHPGEFVITFPFGYHSGYNLGYNCAESVNFALDSWVEIGKKSDSCECKEDSVKIDVAAIFDCDDTEGESDGCHLEDGNDDREDRDGTESVDYSRKEDNDVDKRQVRRQAINLRRRERRRERKLAAAGIVQPEDARQDHEAPNNQTSTTKNGQPTVRGSSITNTKPSLSCVLCPDKTRPEDLVRAGDGIFAHRLCAIFVTETTYIPGCQDGPEGAEAIPDSVLGVGDIPKARWSLKCSLCKYRLGACVQCFKGRCTRAFHVTCAERSGLYMANEIGQDGLREIYCSQHDPNKLLEKRTKKEQVIAQTAAALAVGMVVYARCAGDGTGAYFEASVAEILSERKVCRLKFLDGSSWSVPFHDIVFEDPRTEEQIAVQNLAAIGVYESEKQHVLVPRRDTKTAVERAVTS